MAVKVLGLDLSITGTGLAYTTANDEAVTRTVKTRDKDGDLRLADIRRAVREFGEGADLALIEAPTARSASAVISGMVHGVVRLQLMDMGVPYGTLMPASLKKYATGRGGATKTDMAMAAFKRGGVEFPNDNECDAWWLWVAAIDYLVGLDRCPVKMPAVNRESLNKIRMEG
jgi:Holliday junction resolvasome RuvABC endonuclease subunit